ncbi:hypothetical protein LJR289_001841 [Pseudoduganella sp. LjRoot289]|uniref:hypothetical protein n=1 Tax=Pseudoduganella sp. LjRoot289 TaxID=3342314 RepID=UPI003ECFC6A3
MAQKFLPYANEADVLHIGGLTIENRVDRITIAGDIDLTLDQAGQADARALHKLLTDVLDKMDAQALPAKLPPPDIKTVKNPFA